MHCFMKVWILISEKVDGWDCVPVNTYSVTYVLYTNRLTIVPTHVHTCFLRADPDRRAEQTFLNSRSFSI